MRLRPSPVIAALCLTMAASAPALASDEGSLSSRLGDLAGKDLRSASAADQAHAVSLLAHGPGSLLRDGTSLIVEGQVDVAGSDRVNGLRQAGADILDVNREFAIVTAAVDERELQSV